MADKYINDSLSLNESYYTSDNNYIRWIIGKSLVNNFSFFNDSDLDGQADDWTFNNVSADIVSEDLNYHIQKLVFSSGGYISQDVNVSSGVAHTIFFQYKGSADFYILENGIVKYHCYLSSSSLISYRNTYTPTSSQITIKFAGNSGTFYLDNVYIQEIDKNVFFNPSDFTFNYVSNNKILTTLTSDKIYIQDINHSQRIENIRVVYASITKDFYDYLKTLIGEICLLVTHDGLVCSIHLEQINVVYKYYRSGSKNQIYNVNMNLEFV